MAFAPGQLHARGPERVPGLDSDSGRIERLVDLINYFTPLFAEQWDSEHWNFREDGSWYDRATQCVISKDDRDVVTIFRAANKLRKEVSFSSTELLPIWDALQNRIEQIESDTAKDCAAHLVDPRSLRSWVATGDDRFPRSFETSVELTDGQTVRVICEHLTTLATFKFDGILGGPNDGVCDLDIYTLKVINQQFGFSRANVLGEEQYANLKFSSRQGSIGVKGFFEALQAGHIPSTLNETSISRLLRYSLRR